MITTHFTILDLFLVHVLIPWKALFLTSILDFHGNPSSNHPSLLKKLKPSSYIFLSIFSLKGLVRGILDKVNNAWNFLSCWVLQNYLRLISLIRTLINAMILFFLFFIFINHLNYMYFFFTKATMARLPWFFAIET